MQIKLSSILKYRYEYGLEESDDKQQPTPDEHRENLAPFSSIASIKVKKLDQSSKKSRVAVQKVVL